MVVGAGLVVVMETAAYASVLQQLSPSPQIKNKTAYLPYYNKLCRREGIMTCQKQCTFNVMMTSWTLAMGGGDTSVLCIKSNVILSLGEKSCSSSSDE